MVVVVVIVEVDLQNISYANCLSKVSAQSTIGE